MDIRPRTLGEILDDAWRLARADAPLLLLFQALFAVPAFSVFLLLLAQPPSSGMAPFALPALAALLLPAMGLSSAACQELLRRRFTNSPRQREPLSLARRAWLRHGLAHIAARALVLCGTMPGPLLLLLSFLPDTSPILRFIGFLFGSLLTFLLSVPLWSTCFSLHALLSARESRSGSFLRELRRDAAASPGKAAVLILSRLPLLLFLVLQLHLFAKVILWSADNLGGFDTTLLDLQFALFSNPVYTLALFLLSWLLLAPYFECGNFLLHLDIRTRQEGLDLQHRVQRALTEPQWGRHSCLPDPRQTRMPAPLEGRSLTVAALIFFLAGTMARAEGPEREIIHGVRQEIATIRGEIQKTEPYPGGQRWQGRLRDMQTKLRRIGGGEASRFRWFEQAITDFRDRKKDDALSILDELARRLALLEDSLAPPQPAAHARDKNSPEDIKSLLRGSEGRKIERKQSQQHIEEERPEARREEAQKNEPQKEGPHRGGRVRPVATPAAQGGGFSSLGWLLLGGLVLAVVAVGLFFYLTSPRSPKPGREKPQAETAGLSPESDARQVLEESPAALWRQADALAGDGHFREAVRALYLAVLALLHQRRFIRFETTRTNGEYVRQVRLSEQAPPELHEPFRQLTDLFETAWYGERPCESSDFRDCRVLAEEVQRLAGGGR